MINSRIVYVLIRKPTDHNHIPYMVAICGSREEAEIISDSFTQNSDNFRWYVKIKERQLLKDEVLINGKWSDYFYNGRDDKIIREIIWSKKLHVKYFSSNISFSRYVETLAKLHRIRESIISCLPHDILYYLFSLLEEGEMKINTTDENNVFIESSRAKN